MNKKIITLDVTKVGEGHLETMMSINGSPVDVTFAMVELILKLNDCVNDSGMMKINNGFWVTLQEHVNEELAERAKK